MLVPSLEDYGVAARVDGLDKRPLHLRYPDRFLSGLNGLRSLSARDSNLLPSDHMYLLDGMMGPTPVYDMDEDGEEEGGSWEEAAWESDSGRGGTVLDDGTEPSGRERLGGGSRAQRKRGCGVIFIKSAPSSSPTRSSLFLIITTDIFVIVDVFCSKLAIQR